jgi:hypothetical protein
MMLSFESVCIYCPATARLKISLNLDYTLRIRRAPRSKMPIGRTLAAISEISKTLKTTEKSINCSLERLLLSAEVLIRGRL